MRSVGFILLTHNKPGQILRLVRRLNSMFDNPPIVCHHDFGKCPLPDGFLPQNVSFVRPHLSTGWAEFTVVQANVLALAQMYLREDAPDWCVTLSGSCYPTKSAAQILANLNAGGYDAHIEGQRIERHLLHDEWLRMFHERYCVKEIAYPSVNRRLRPLTRHVRLPHFLARYLLPYHAGLRCFAGSQWFSVSRRAAAYIAAFQGTSDAEALAKHSQNMLFSEESYFQSVLHSAPRLHVNPGNWVYVDWSERKPNPKLLTLADLPAIAASPAHFARKVDLDTEASAQLMDALDQIIGGNMIGGNTFAAAALKEEPR